jgi:hypothetical protein
MVAPSEQLEPVPTPGALLSAGGGAGPLPLGLGLSLLPPHRGPWRRQGREPSKASRIKMQNMMPRRLATRPACRSRASSLRLLRLIGLYRGRRRRPELSNEQLSRPSIQCRRGPGLLLPRRLACPA